MKTLFLTGILVVLVALPLPAAEFYRYVDRKGNILYTDDLSKVPPEQRDRVTSYTQSETAAPETLPEAAEEIRIGPAADKNQNQQEERNQLEAAGKALDQEYETLIQERTQLDGEKNQAVTNEQIKAYNQQIIEFNSRIKAYEEKRNAYTEQVRAFNAKIDSGRKE